MDIVGLRLFVAAAEMRNISGAGRMLGMALAVSSARLAKLEKDLGAELLHRSTRKVALSADGEAFLPYAREILAQESTARAALGQGRESVAGTLRVAAPSTFAQLYLMPLLPEFSAAHPGLDLDLRLSDTQHDLIEGSFDLAIRNTRAEDSSLRGRKLAQDTRVLCAAPDYLAREGDPATPEALAGHALIGFQTSQPRTLVAASGERAAFDPGMARHKLVLDDGASQRIATLAGCGISACSIWSIAEELSSGALRRVLPEYRIDAETALWLVYPRSNVLTAKVRVFIDFLIARVAPTLTAQLDRLA